MNLVSEKEKQSDKERLSDKIDTVFAALKPELMYFHDKDPEYAEKMVDWFLEVAIKNHIIHRYKNDPSKKDKEMVRRRRARVYYIDFGVNVGSEFNYPHFCVVVKEFKYHALVVPLSSLDEDDTQSWKLDEENMCVEIGEIKDLPFEKPKTYALVGKMREVSKQRLSDYRHPETKEFVKLKLTDDQMDKIDEAIIKLCTKNKKEETKDKTNLQDQKD